jgi:hypothetical protein
VLFISATSEKMNSGETMHSRYTVSLRFVSSVVLFFFMWSFGGLKETAWAAKNGLDTPAAKISRGIQKEKRAEEKLDRTIKDIESLLRSSAGRSA